MDRQTILEEIRRLAADSNGVAPGQGQFEKLTGISTGVWRGKYWLRWSEAVIEAGFVPGRLKEAVPENTILTHLANLTKKCGHFPTFAELRMERVRDQAFPHHSVFDRLGNHYSKIVRLREFASANEEFSTILAIVPNTEDDGPGPQIRQVDQDAPGDGYVYMLKLGKHYKVGKTFSVPRRHREIALELPEKPDVVHSIRTDDPDGIEAYWHKRFKQKQTNGEWFSLDIEDVRAFKRRKFM